MALVPSKSQTSLLLLPDDLLLKILSVLARDRRRDSLRDLLNLRQTCRRLSETVGRDTLWQRRVGTPRELSLVCSGHPLQDVIQHNLTYLQLSHRNEHLIASLESTPMWNLEILALGVNTAPVLSESCFPRLRKLICCDMTPPYLSTLTSIQAAILDFQSLRACEGLTSLRTFCSLDPTVLTPGNFTALRRLSWNVGNPRIFDGVRESEDSLVAVMQAFGPALIVDATLASSDALVVEGVPLLYFDRLAFRKVISDLAWTRHTIRSVQFNLYWSSPTFTVDAFRDIQHVVIEEVNCAPEGMQVVLDATVFRATTHFSMGGTDQVIDAGLVTSCPPGAWQIYDLVEWVECKWSASA